MTNERPNIHADNFHTTRWSLVERAGNQCERALESLCTNYWYPLYAYARRRMDLESAQDSTQAFFTVLLEKNYAGTADQNKGKFRSFLLTAFKRFLANQYDRERTVKRGGKLRKLSLDFENADSKSTFQPADDLTSEKVFERQWVLTLLENVMTRMIEYYSDKGTVSLRRFELLKHHVLGDPETNYANLCSKLDMTPEAMRVHVHRMRQKYRDTLRDEIAGTIDRETEIDDEIRQMFEILG